VRAGELLIRRVLTVTAPTPIHTDVKHLGFLKEGVTVWVDLHGPQRPYKSFTLQGLSATFSRCFCRNETLTSVYPDAFADWQQTRKEREEFEAETALSNPATSGAIKWTEIGGTAIRGKNARDGSAGFRSHAPWTQLLEPHGRLCSATLRIETALLTQLGEIG